MSDYPNIISHKELKVLRAERDRYKEALEKIAKHWFNPSEKGRGVCGSCDGGLMYPEKWRKLEHHEADCPLEIAKQALEGEEK